MSEFTDQHCFFRFQISQKLSSINSVYTLDFIVEITLRLRAKV